MKIPLTYEELDAIKNNKWNLNDLVNFVEKSKGENKIMNQWYLDKSELNKWNWKKKKFTKDEICVLCGKPAQTLHHPKPTWCYKSFKEYYNEINQTPVCHFCHRVGLHATPIYVHFNKKKYGEWYYFYRVGGNIPTEDSMYKLVFKDFKRKLKMILCIKNYFDEETLNNVINNFIKYHNALL